MRMLVADGPTLVRERLVALLSESEGTQWDGQTGDAGEVLVSVQELRLVGEQIGALGDR